MPNGALWARSTVGVEGGIPTGWAVATTLSPSGSDDTSAINTALFAARATNAVVKLAAGTFQVSGEINTAPGTILRGTLDTDGTRLTTIEGTGSASVIYFKTGGSHWFGQPIHGDSGDTTVTANRPTGSTTLSFPAPSVGGITIDAGDYFWITQDNDSDTFNLTNSDVVKGGREGGFPWAVGQMCKVTAITKGANYDVTFAPALRWDFTTARNAAVGFGFGGYGNTLRNCGVEDLIVTNSPAASSNDRYTIATDYTTNCWLKNVESKDAATGHVNLQHTKNFEIRHCYFHGGHQPTSGGGGYGYGIVFALYPTDCLVEDNILSNVSDPIMAPVVLGYGANGNVIAYNYTPFSAMIFANMVEEHSIHSAFSLFNLFEGNIGQKFYADNYHGGSRYMTLFRNWFKGTQTGATGARTCVTIDEENLSYSVIGNVLGSAGFTYSPGTAIPSGATKYIYQLGFGSTGDRYRDNPTTTDTRVVSTTVIHGNWDSANTAQTFDGGIADHALPGSYYYSSKPAFFGVLPWPAVDPTAGVPIADDFIPAAYRFLNGVEVPTSSSPQHASGFLFLP